MHMKVTYIHIYILKLRVPVWYLRAKSVTYTLPVSLRVSDHYVPASEFSYLCPHPLGTKPAGVAIPASQRVMYIFLLLTPYRYFPH